MKFKSFVVAILTTFVLLASASSYALDVYLDNSSTHDVLYFKFPNYVTYGPVQSGQEVKLPVELARNLAYTSGEVLYATHSGLHSCGFVDFSRVTVLAFRVNMFKQCNVVAG